MIRSPSLKIAFIHVPRTGGSSVKQVCKATWPDWADAGYRSHVHWNEHAPAEDMLYRVEDWSAYYSFAFVRNPWERAVSAWTQLTGHRMDFRQWLISHIGRGGPQGVFTQPQTGMVLSRAGSPLVSKIGRFETFAADFAEISARWGATEPPPMVLQSQHAPYHTYYTPETREIVAQYYRSDVAAFDYKF